MSETAYNSSVLVVLIAFPSVRHELIIPNWRAPFVDHCRRHTLDRVARHDFLRPVAGFLHPEWKEWRNFCMCGVGIDKIEYIGAVDKA